jgi:hypothetical protein
LIPEPRGGELTDLGGPFPVARARREQVGVRTHAVVWLGTTLVFSLLPFALLPIVYHAFEVPHRWPSIIDLLGKGDIALVTAAVLGANVAELVQDSRASLAARAVLVATSTVVGMVSIAIYAVAQYQLLLSRTPDLDVNTYVLSGGLTICVLIQCYLILRRSTEVST